MVWKFVDFSATQILGEINFWISKSAKTAIFANLRAVSFVNLVNITLQKVQKICQNQILESQNL